MHNSVTPPATTGQIVPLRPEWAPRRDAASDAQTIGAAAIVARLGQAHGRSQAWQANYLTGLIAQHGFPAPYPILRGASTVTGIVWKSSRWNLAAVEAWLEGWGLPPGAGGLAARRAAQVDQDVAAALETLKRKAMA